MDLKGIDYLLGDLLITTVFVIFCQLGTIITLDHVLRLAALLDHGNSKSFQDTEILSFLKLS